MVSGHVSAAIRPASGTTICYRKQRYTCGVSRCDAGDRIRVARTTGHHRHRGATCHTRPAVGHVNGSRFMTRVNDGESISIEHLQRRVQVIADQREDVSDA